jgi:hypothetical protein
MEMLAVPPQATHANGAPIYLLQFADPWTMIADLFLRPGVQNAIMGMGGNSATFGTLASGTITTTPANAPAPA